MADSTLQAGHQQAERILREGSKSFYFAARLLRQTLRQDVASIYAFCRLSDDAVDESRAPQDSLAQIKEQLDRIYQGTAIKQNALWPPLMSREVEAAFAQAVTRHKIPRGPFDALVEGYVWDAQGRTYSSFDDLLGYCARVAASVGVVMTYALGRRHPFLLHRAIEMGLAMQLTNIARDIATDAKMGRVYLPDTWLAEVNISRQELLQAAPNHPAIALLTRKVLLEARALYKSARPGIQGLPRTAQGAIGAASSIYEDIGQSLSRQGFDPFLRRAMVSKSRKAWLALKAVLRAIFNFPPSLPKSLDESFFCPSAARFLVDGKPTGF